MLTTRFMTIVEQRHIVPKLSKRVFEVFVNYLSDLKDFLPQSGIGDKKKEPLLPKTPSCIDWG